MQILTRQKKNLPLGNIETAPRQLSLFQDRLPRRPYCTDNLAAGMNIRPTMTAVEKRYIQYNPHAIINWLAFDIDRVYVAEAEYTVIAQPNIIVRNRENGHAHLLYGIAAGVSKTSASRPGPIRLLAAINEGFRHTLGADVGFTELICKNPLHAHWEVTTPRVELYDLAEMAEWVDLDASDKRRRATPKRAQVGLGRNCNLFNSLRTWAYRWVGEYRSRGSDMWYAAVLDKAERLNTFNDPLPASEIRATAKSTARWTWNHYNGHQTASSLAEDGLTPATFALLQSNLGKIGMAKRWGDNSDKKEQAGRMSAEGLSAREIAGRLEVGHATVSRWLKDTVS